VKGKEKVSDPTPEGAGAGGGNPPPPPPKQRAAGAPGGGDPDDEGEGSGLKPDERRKGRRDKRPAAQPEADDYEGNKELFELLSRVMGHAMGRRTRVWTEPPAVFNNANKDRGMWLLPCWDYFGQKPVCQWEEKAD